jgi:preprotein translocase subunit SecA
MSKILKVIFGDPNKKLLASLRKDVERINSFEVSVTSLSDEGLRGKTAEFKDRLSKGETLEDVVHEAFAVVREAARRTLGQRHFDVQLIGGLVLHRGQIAEMKTGEGKTLTSTLALYTNALRGQGCHLVTVNDYLARRDSVWMGQIYNFLGLSVGCIQHEGGFVYDPAYKQEVLPPEGNPPLSPLGKGGDLGAFHIREDYLRPVSRNEAYAADITYGTNNQFGFDYLRDNMSPTVEQCVMRELHYAIVDEVDSILIDEARTPLIISAPAEKSGDLYARFSSIIAGLRENEHYNVDEKMRTATLTDAGIEQIERTLGIENLYAIEQGQYQRFADTALRARANYQLDVHYVVQNGEVVIVDEFTGRLMPGRRFSEGIHQAIEAKEGVEVQRESQTLATITFQNLFRMYHKLAGMTGTAATEAEEFSKIYNLEVVEIPTNQPVVRADLGDRIYKSEMGKFQAVVEDIKQRQQKGQPVLVGTVSVEKNEALSTLLKNAGIQHEVLNAKNHAREGEIIAQAGRVGAVTIATNMAGRGVDIKLGGNPAAPEEEARVKEQGGLHVIGTERHDARRIDNQLRGRAGRQGDPGSTQFFLSMDDSLMRIFGSDRARGMMDRLGIPDDLPIENRFITSSIEKAQTRVEGYHFDARKHLLEYDDVLNKHREVIYARRRDVLETFAKEPEKLRDRILDVIEGEVEQIVLFHSSEGGVEGKWNLPEIAQSVGTIVALTQEDKSNLEGVRAQESGDRESIATRRSDVIGIIMEIIRREYDRLNDIFEDRASVNNIERGVVLRAMDILWIDHLAAMGALRTGIGLRGYGQRDPLIEYKREGYDLFQMLLSSINHEVSYSFFKYAKHAVDMKVQAELARSVFQKAGITFSGAQTTSVPLLSKEGSGEVASSVKKIGRNDLCPAEAEKSSRSVAHLQANRSYRTHHTNYVRTSFRRPCSRARADASGGA